MMNSPMPLAVSPGCRCRCRDGLPGIEADLTTAIASSGGEPSLRMFVSLVRTMKAPNRTRNPARAATPTKRAERPGRAVSSAEAGNGTCLNPEGDGDSALKSGGRRISVQTGRAADVRSESKYSRFEVSLGRTEEGQSLHGLAIEDDKRPLVPALRLRDELRQLLDFDHNAVPQRRRPGTGFVPSGTTRTRSPKPLAAGTGPLARAGTQSAASVRRRDAAQKRCRNDQS